MSRLPLIIGHRGASTHAPENTLAALQMALDAGADGVEFDVQLARDEVPVVIHDPNLRRVAGLNAAILDISSAELADIDVGSWFNAEFPERASASFSRETVPTLDRVLGLLEDASGLVYLELKTDGGDPGPLVKRVCETIRSSSVLPRLIVKSFCLNTLEKVRRELPQTATAALFEPRVRTVFRRRANLIGMAAGCGANHISLHWLLVNRRLVESANDAQIPITVWTVNDPRWVGKAREMGIRSLITNDPAKFIAARDGSSANFRDGQ